MVSIFTLATKSANKKAPAPVGREHCFAVPPTFARRSSAKIAPTRRRVVHRERAPDPAGPQSPQATSSDPSRDLERGDNGSQGFPRLVTGREYRGVHPFTAAAPRWHRREAEHRLSTCRRLSRVRGLSLHILIIAFDTMVDADIVPPPGARVNRDLYQPLMTGTVSPWRRPNKARYSSRGRARRSSPRWRILSTSSSALALSKEVSAGTRNSTAARRI